MLPAANKIARVLLATGILLYLLQVWLPAYYPNCDGPCHLSNAAIMGEMWWGKADSIYHRFYDFNYQPDPNWLTEVMLAVLQIVFKNTIAEKILLTVYILLMTAGITTLLRRMGNKGDWWALCFFVLIMHNAVAQGFYNFTLSVAFYLLLVNVWLSFLDNRRWWRAIAFAVLLAVTYFSHPVSFVFGCFTCGALWLSYILAGNLQNAKEKLMPLLLLVVSVLPFVVMFLGFANRHGGVAEIKAQFYSQRLEDMAACRHLLNYSHKEEDVLIAVGITFIAFFLLFWFYRLKEGKGWHKYDGFILTLLFALTTFLILPDAMLGGGYFVLRAGIYTMLLLLVCCAYVPMPTIIGKAGGGIMFGLFVILFFIRMPVIYKAADAIEDHMGAAAYIKPGTVVLPLNYDTWGRDREEKVISSRNNIFCHMAQYLTTKVPNVVVLDNFEANTDYFPLKWHKDKDPYVHLGRWPGMQAVPPAGDIMAYKTNTGITVDYVLVMNPNTSYSQFETATTLWKEVQRDYNILYKSPTGRTVLYERNKVPNE